LSFSCLLKFDKIWYRVESGSILGNCQNNFINSAKLLHRALFFDDLDKLFADIICLSSWIWKLRYGVFKFFARYAAKKNIFTSL